METNNENRAEFDFRKTIGHKLRKVSLANDRYFQILKSSGVACLPKGQGPMMGYLVDHRDEIVCQKDLEQAFLVSGATVSNMLSSLEKAGLIERVQMEADGRLKRIVPTQAGIDYEVSVRKQILRLEEAMVCNFTEEEKAQLVDLLARVEQNIHNLRDNT